MRTNVNVVIPVYKPDEKLIQIGQMLKKQTIPVAKLILMVTCEECGGELSYSAETGRVIGQLERIFTEANEPDVKGSKNKASDGKESQKKAFEDKGSQNKASDGIKTKVMDLEIKKVALEDFDHGNTRRQGAEAADADCDFLLFMTQDAVPDNEYLIESLIKPFSDEKVAASYARQLASDNSSLSEKFTRGFNYPDEDRIKTVEDIEAIGIKAFFCSNVCAMYRKSSYEELGGFVKKTIFNEDMIFANKILKSGYKIAYASKARVVHTHDYTGMQQYKRNFDLAVSQALNPQAFEGISSESEGVKYVMAAFKYFSRNLRPLLIIPFGINCVYKYLGYKKGKKIASLTREEALKASSNPGFFKDLTVDENIVKTVMDINGIEY